MKKIKLESLKVTSFVAMDKVKGGAQNLPDSVFGFQCKTYFC